MENQEKVKLHSIQTFQVIIISCENFPPISFNSPISQYFFGCTTKFWTKIEEKKVFLECVLKNIQDVYDENKVDLKDKLKACFILIKKSFL